MVNSRISGIQESGLHFGPHLIDSSNIFATTAHSFAFVNIKPVLEGRQLFLLVFLNDQSILIKFFLFQFFKLIRICVYRSRTQKSMIKDVLVAPIRPVTALKDLKDAETADLFILAKKIQKIIQVRYLTAAGKNNSHL